MINLTNKLLTLLCAVLLYSCVGSRLCPEVEIPTSDSTAPRIAFNIRGPGLNENYSTDDWPSGQLNLKTEGRYNFILTINDPSGSRLAQMQVPGDYLLEVENLSPDRVQVREISSLSSMLSLTNSESNPKSCLVISGVINTSENAGNNGLMGFGAFDFNTNVNTADLNLNLVQDLEDVGFRAF